MLSFDQDSLEKRGSIDATTQEERKKSFPIQLNTLETFFCFETTN